MAEKRPMKHPSIRVKPSEGSHSVRVHAPGFFCRTKGRGCENAADERAEQTYLLISSFFVGGSNVHSFEILEYVYGKHALVDLCYVLPGELQSSISLSHLQMRRCRFSGGG